MPPDSDITEIAREASRRGLLKGVGIGAAAFGLMGFAGPARADADAKITDEDILNFALNLEYLEAEFYLNAVYGHGLPPGDCTGTGMLGKVNGGAKVPFSSNPLYQYAREIANDEHNHVLFLRQALGNMAVARPAIDLNSSFTTVGRASEAFPAGTAFNPFASQEMFLLGAFVFEDVGVTAYSGAAPSIANKDYLAAAAGILAVEAYHASEVRLQIVQHGVALSEKADRISTLRAKLSGAADDQGPDINSHYNIVPTDKNSIAFARTPAQVLNIVYGGGAASNYLFFPDKMNGTIS